MSEKTCPIADIYLNRNSGVYHFSFGEDGNWGSKSLEDVLTEVSKYLRGQSWCKHQRAELIVIGRDAHGNEYVLNNPKVWMVEQLAEEYGENDMPALKRINNRRIVKVVVRNMMLKGKESVILRAYAKTPSTAHGYCELYPEVMSLNTQELDAMMTELMKLHMLNLAQRPAVKWLRSKYRDE